jgi:hypothetical protein
MSNHHDMHRAISESSRYSPQVPISSFVFKDTSHQTSNMQQFSRRNMFRLIIEWRESLAGHLCLLHLSAPCSICNRSPSGWQLRRAIHPCPAAPKITVSHITANRPAATIYAFLNTCTFHRKHSSRPVGQLAGSHSAMPLTETWAFGNLLALSLQAF